MKTLILLLFSSLVAHAATFTLQVAVDLQSTNDIRAVHILWGTASRVYSSGVIFSNVTALAVTNIIPNFQPQTTYYFACTAIDRFGQESLLSAETIYTTGLPLPPPPPVFRVITNSLQGAISPQGPFEEVTNWVYVVPSNSYSFFRGRVDISP